MNASELAKVEKKLEELRSQRELKRCDAERSKKLPNSSRLGCGGLVFGGLVTCIACWFVKSIFIPELAEATNQQFRQCCTEPKDSVNVIEQEINGSIVTNISDWITIQQLGRVEFMIPPSMEIRNKTYAKIVREFSKVMNVPCDGNEIVVQQKGLNAVEASANLHYFRLIYNCQIGDVGDLCKRGDAISGYRYFQLLELGRCLKRQLECSVDQSNDHSRILKWESIKVIRFGDYAAVKLVYLRQYESNEPVNVMVYLVCDDNRLHTILFSCRKSELCMWLPEWETIKKTFRFGKKEGVP